MEERSMALGHGDDPCQINRSKRHFLGSGKVLLKMYFLYTGGVTGRNPTDEWRQSGRQDQYKWRQKDISFGCARR